MSLNCITYTQLHHTSLNCITCHSTASHTKAKLVSLSSLSCPPVILSRIHENTLAYTHVYVHTQANRVSKRLSRIHEDTRAFSLASSNIHVHPLFDTVLACVRKHVIYTLKYTSRSYTTRRAVYEQCMSETSSV